MRILFHHRIASQDGQYVHVEELVAALRQLGHEVTIVGPKVLEKKGFGSEDGFVSALRKHLPKSIYELLELGYSVIAYRRLKKAVLKHRPDCIYERYNLFSPAGVWLSKKYGLPLGVEVNAPLFDERSRYGGIALPKLADWSESYVWHNADALFVVTDVLADRVADTGVPRDRIEVVHNGIDLNRFVPGDPDAAKRELGLEGRLVLGFAGFARDWHGLDRVVRLLASPAGSNGHFLLVGDGPAVDGIRRLAAELGVTDRITITGIVDRDAIPRYVNGFDIALQPDVVDYASPLKMFEYLALGRAVVAPDKPNIREIINHGENGYLFDPDSPDGFAEAVSSLCQNSELREHLGKTARETIVMRDLTWSNNAARVVETFEALVQQVDRIPAT